eukprot:9744210-Lingulodinium_polyedra.AAC.1
MLNGNALRGRFVQNCVLAAPRGAFRGVSRRARGAETMRLTAFCGAPPPAAEARAWGRKRPNKPTAGHPHKYHATSRSFARTTPRTTSKIVHGAPWRNP